ncbi:YHS domain-containing protein, partial [Candidatus Parcubacteria bacterium]
MPRDPVCGMEVEQDSENVRTFRGAEFRFCSAHCLEKFNENPNDYLGEDVFIDPVCGM